MPAPQPTKFYGLDHLRSLAIILVFFFHYQLPFFGHPQWVADVARFGWTGVDLFFVLSGYLISSQLFEQVKASGSISLKIFFTKRIFRIIPAYAVVVAIYFLLPSFHEREALPPFWKFATFTQNIGLDLRTQGTFSHAWSLCVEEHFYLLLPLALVLLLQMKWFRHGYWLLAGLFVLGVVMRWYCWSTFYEPLQATPEGGVQWYQYIYYPTWCRLDGLVAGVSVAVLYHYAPNTWHRISGYGNVFVVLGIAVLTGAYFVCLDQQSFAASVWGFPLVAVGYGLMVMGAVSPGSFIYGSHSKVTAFIAAVSYSVYLSHKGIIHLIQQAADVMHIAADSNTMLIICIVVAVAGALLLRLVVERPFIKLGRYLSSRF